MPLFEDNLSPYLTLVEQGSDPTTPGATHQLLYVKSGGVYVKNSAATVTGPFGAGGGGITQAFAGYNTAGGSQENMTQHLVYAKSVTLANDCLLTSVEAYLDSGAGTDIIGTLAAALYTDNAGTPDRIVALGGFGDTNNLLLDNTNGGGGGTTGRWVATAMGKWLTAGTYWIAVANMTSNASIGMRIYYDGSGADRTYPSGGVWFTDWGFYSPTTTSNKYSIRANTIR